VKFFIDHNLSPQLIPPLLAIHPKHNFKCALEEGLTAVEDIPLFAELVDRQFQAIITRDRNQLTDAEERAALEASGLHWLGVKDTHVKGLLGIALDSASITIGLTIVLPELATGQCAYRFPAVPHQHQQRAKRLALRSTVQGQQGGASVRPDT
jgi:hypothetical protein